MKVSNFCLNAAVYRSGQGAPQTDQLCLVVDEKYIFFFEHKLHSKEIRFEKDPAIERGYNIAIKPSQLHWDDDKIYLSNKRAYVVMRKSDGQIITKVDIDKQEVPPFAVSKSKCLVLNDRNTGQYLTDNGISDQIKFEFDPNKKIVSLFLVDMYVIVVYETSVCIYNASNGDFLEERGKLDKFKYKAAAVNIEGTEVYLAANNIKEARNTIQSEVYLMKEIPAQK